MEDDNTPLPRIASQHRPQYDYHHSHIEEVNKSELWMKWLWPISGWAYMIINFIIISAAAYKMIFEGYSWSTHGALVIGFGSSFAIVAAINRYIVKEFKENVRPNN